MSSLLEIVCSFKEDPEHIHTYFKEYQQKAHIELTEYDVILNTPPIFIFVCCNAICNKELIDALIENGADLNFQYINPITQDSYFHPLIYLANNIDVLQHVLRKYGHSICISKELFQQLLFNYACFSYDMDDIIETLALIVKNTTQEVVASSIFVFFIFSCGQYYLNKVFLSIVNELHQGIYADHILSHAAEISTSRLFQRYHSRANWWEDIQCLHMLDGLGFDIFTPLSICSFSWDNIEDPENISVFDLGQYYLGSISWDDLHKMSNASIIRCYRKMVGNAQYQQNHHIIAYAYRLRKLCMKLYEGFVRRKYHPSSPFMKRQYTSWGIDLALDQSESRSL
jgi:hypothetical protein